MFGSAMHVYEEWWHEGIVECIVCIWRLEFGTHGSIEVWSHLGATRVHVFGCGDESWEATQRNAISCVWRPELRTRIQCHAELVCLQTYQIPAYIIVICKIAYKYQHKYLLYVK